MSVAAVCAVVASAAALLIIRRHSRYKNKFEGLIGSSAEVSKDYQVNILLRYNDTYLVLTLIVNEYCNTYLHFFVFFFYLGIMPSTNVE